MKEVESGNKEHTISLLSNLLNKLKGNSESQLLSFLVTWLDLFNLMFP